jgi:co-chaperonin GroES (HSP10)
MKMAHEVDPKEALLKELGDIKPVKVFNNQVLIAVYIRPEKTKGGIFLANQVRDEDRFQSKVGLVVKAGPVAFVEDEPKWFRDIDVQVGDWIVFRPSDGWNITVNGVLCRMLQDTNIRMKIDTPDRVW